MNGFEIQKIDDILCMPDSEDDRNIPNELWGIIYSLGRDAENEEEFCYSFDVLCMLCHRQNASIRAQAILALSLLAVTNGHLDRSIVEPIIQREWSAASPSNKAVILDAVEDINLFLKWELGLSDITE